MRYFSALPIFLLFALLAVGCATEADDQAAAEYELATHADTVAMNVYEALGGPEAWASVPVLRFDFAAEQGGQRTLIRSHLWNRQTGDYRVEWQRGPDSAYVVVFDVDTQEGQAAMNGTPVPEAEQEQLLQNAYRSFINDTYWMLMPVKMMDPGVTRTYVADSSDADTDVIRLSFQDVGLTPGDQYWVFVDKTTGQVEEWAFRLQSGGAGRFAWTDYRPHQVPGGTITIAERKQGGDRALLTDNVEVMPEPPEGAFTDMNPMLLTNAE